MTAAVTPNPSTEAQTGAVPLPRKHADDDVQSPVVKRPAADPDRLLHQHTRSCWWDVAIAGWVCG